jgi:hypothetical protein
MCVRAVVLVVVNLVLDAVRRDGRRARYTGSEFVVETSACLACRTERSAFFVGRLSSRARTAAVPAPAELGVVADLSQQFLLPMTAVIS